MNEQLFKEAMGNYPTGVTVITAIKEDGTPIGLTVNSFASVSIDPTLILWSIDKRVGTHDDFKRLGRFAVNILSEDQSDVCSTFASKVDRFSKVEWKLSQDNLPIIEGAASVLQCGKFKTIEAGDHTIIIGRVVDIQNNNKSPLLYHKRNFGPIPKEFYGGNK